jgi:hypothetical protein
MPLAYLQILRQPPKDWFFLAVLFHNHSGMWDSSVLMARRVHQGQATSEGRDCDKMRPAKEVQDAVMATLFWTLLTYVTGRVTDMIGKAVQMNSFCSDCFDTETSGAPFNMLIRSGGNETVYVSLRRCSCSWSRDSRPRSPKEYWWFFGLSLGSCDYRSAWNLWGKIYTWPEKTFRCEKYLEVFWTQKLGSSRGRLTGKKLLTLIFHGTCVHSVKILRLFSISLNWTRTHDLPI